uniref:Knottin scorpion toxin-like domain-containing protein n=4 Tax=Triticinae TaxID=1648030 RepID=A0A453FUT0_AEGTS
PHQLRRPKQDSCCVHSPVPAMEAWRRNALRCALLVLLLAVSSGVARAQGGGECWSTDMGYGICVKPGGCRAACHALGKNDGQCNGGYFWPVCECLSPHCH